MIFDTHAHYDSQQFDQDRDFILGEYLPQNGVAKIINCASSYDTAKFSIDLAEKYDYVYAAVGVHPEEIPTDEKPDCERLKALAAHKKCVAVGEIGLEYHYDIVPRDIQKEWFEQQIILANDLDLPVIVHDREAHADTMEIIRRNRPKGVLHCFSGSVEMEREVIKSGMYIGLGGAVTFKNAKTPVMVAMDVPLDRLLLETDCPYMAPVPFRGKRNDSSLIKYTAQVIAAIRSIDVDTLINACYKNACELFGIK